MLGNSSLTTQWDDLAPPLGMKVINDTLVSASGRSCDLEVVSPFVGRKASVIEHCISSSSGSPSSNANSKRRRESSITSNGSTSSDNLDSLVAVRKPSRRTSLQGTRLNAHVRRPKHRHDSITSTPEEHNHLGQAVRSPEIHRIQLQAEFMHYYFPWTAQEPHFIPNQKIIMHQPKTLTLQTALDALYLIQVGSTMRDERVVAHGRLSYHAALQRVRRDLSRPNSVYDDSLLAAIHMLATCEKYEALNNGENSPAQRQHLNGAAHMLQLRGPLSIRTEIQQYQLQQHLLHALFQGCMSRKANVFGSKEWAAATAGCGPIAQLINDCLRVPSLLEQVDVLREESKDRTPETIEVLTLLMALQKLETELQTWLTIWNEETHRPSSYKKVDSKVFPFFYNLPAELAKVLPTCYKFNSFTCASVHSVCWFSTMLLREAMKDVQALQPWSAFRREDQTELIDSAVDEAAEEMCKCVFYLAQQEHGTHGFSSACAPLRFAAQWYGRSANEQRLAWCNECMTQVNEVHGVRARFLIWRTPPRVEETAD